MFLTTQEIRERLRKDKIIDYWKPENVKQAHYELHLGDEVYLSTQREPRKLSDAHPYVTIKPGEFALLLTEEEIRMPDDLIGLITIRLKYKRLGLINISGFHVDPGYKGKIMFAVYNAGPHPVTLRKGDSIFMIFFAKLSEKDAKPYEHGEHKEIKKIRPEWVMGLRGPPVSLVDVFERVKRLEEKVNMIIILFTAIFAIIVSILLHFLRIAGG